MKFWAKTNGKKAELYIYDYIGADFFGEGITAQSVTDAMKDFTPKAQIDVFINSPGGSVFEGIAIYNILRRWDGKKSVHIDGIAASIASIVAMAGDDIMIADNGMVMIHEPWGVAMGTSEDIRKVADALDKVHGSIRDTYVTRTGSSANDIEAWMSAETWMNADEAIARGFATVKVEQKAIKAEFPMLAKFKNTPEPLRRQGMDSRVLLARMGVRTAQMNRGHVPARTTRA